VLRQRPLLYVELLVGLSWLALFAMLAQARPGGSGMGGLWWCAPGMATMSSMSKTPSASIATGLPMWALMSVAMMLPAALPAVKHVARNSLRWRRRRATAQFVAVYLGIWIAFGALALALLAPLRSVPAGALLAAALTLAAAWQLTLPKRRALSACHRSSALPPRGWRATAGVLRFGVRNGCACLASCWALMLVMAVATSGQALWSLALAGVISAEKLMRTPRRATRGTAVLLGAAALGAAVGTALA
jgi:predicted metal-binding membrane protein